jgi:FlaA1/EpsC-like NDP-sugar epimerase
VMTTDRAVELAIRAAEVARGGEVFVFKMPAAGLTELVAAAIAVAAPASGRDPASIGMVSIEQRPGEKAYEELMTEDESRRAFDIGEMYAVMPSIESRPEVLEAYREAPSAPVGAYRSDTVELLPASDVRSLVQASFMPETIATDRRLV